MKKTMIFAAALILLCMGTAKASMMDIDFTSETFAAANLQSSYSFNVNGIQGEMTAETLDGSGLLTYNVGSGGDDGIGIFNEYEYDEIEGGEVLAISFLTAMPIASFTVTDLFQEKGYLGNPKGKTKSVVMTEEGYQKSQQLFQRLFGN